MPACAFLIAAQRYWRTVFPRVRVELRGWRRRAGSIPDAQLRAVALSVQRSKLSNIEGAAAFAAFAPAAHGKLVARAQVCFQAIYDYVDSLAEAQQRTPIRNGRQLHLALVRALDLRHAPIDHYAHSERSDDGGYLQALVECCRAAFETLPSRVPVAADAVGFAERIVAYQSLNLGRRQGGQQRLARWARRHAPAHSGLRWWEVAASAGSSLGVFALIALAAHRPVEQAEANAVSEAYFPWIGSLHSLLDSLVDYAEDLAAGDGSLVAHYEGQAQASARIAAIATEASRRAGALPRGAWHSVVLAAMVSSYLSQQEAQAPPARPVAGAVLDALGGLVLPAMAVFRVRRLARAVMACTMASVPLCQPIAHAGGCLPAGARRWRGDYSSTGLFAAASCRQSADADEEMRADLPGLSRPGGMSRARRQDDAQRWIPTPGKGDTLSPKMGSRSGARLTEPRFSQSLETGLLVMKGFSSQQPLQGIADVADRMEASRSTVHRYMTTLVALGMLEQDPLSRRYRVSLLPADIGVAALDASRVVRALDGHLDGLRRQTGCTVRLGVLVDLEVLLASTARSCAQGQGLLGVQLRRGARLPSHATALGKVLLGALDPKRLRELLASTALAKLTPQTLTSKRALASEVAAAREQGFALEREEAEQGTVGVAVPVLDSTGEQVAALGLVAHAPVGLRDLQRSLPALRASAETLGAQVAEREPKRRGRRRSA